MAKGNKKEGGAGEPRTFEELVDEAIQLEEKGDRYKDGEKAKRFYERACAMYEAADNLQPNDFDVVYNLGRLQLLLSEFPECSPSESAQLITMSIGRLRKGADLMPSNADNLYNLAQAILSKVNLMGDEENVWTDERVSLLSEASALLEKTVEMQRISLDVEHDHPEEEDTSEAIEEHEAQADQEEYETVVEVEPVTNESVHDTLMLHAQINTLQGVAAIAQAFSRVIAEFDRAAGDSFFVSAEAKIEEATRLFPESKEAAIRRAEIYSNRGDALCEVVEMDFQARQGLEGLIEESYDRCIKILTELLGKDSYHVQALCDRADAMLSLANFRVDALGGGSLTAEQLSAARELYKGANNGFTQAQNIEKSNLNIAIKIGDTMLAATRLYSADNEKVTRKVLAGNAGHWYDKAAKLGGMRNRAMIERDGTVDDSTKLILKLAKALSWNDNDDWLSAADVLSKRWKTGGGKFGANFKNFLAERDDDVCGVGFAPRVFDSDWYKSQ
ncbi:hypothetical protein BJ742DRAFT_821804 [Cladochytrium replicatum]|nr:hypothetical protein BJ742DRAFT_821804 [Cladochytrium replicatum]